MPTWPLTLPQSFLFDNYKETDKNLVVSFNPDVGPPITRKRASANVLPFSGSMLVTTAQKLILRAFWEENCALAFDFPDPDTGATISVMFVASNPPVYTPATGGYWRADLQMVKLP